jgi:hypothetical protein
MYSSSHIDHDSEGREGATACTHAKHVLKTVEERKSARKRKREGGVGERGSGREGQYLKLPKLGQLLQKIQFHSCLCLGWYKHEMIDSSFLH